MKTQKVLVAFILLIFAFSLKPVYANSGPPIIGINITPEGCDEGFENNELISIFEGNFDILVKKTDFEPSDFGDMTTQFKSFYPFYEEIEYLQNNEDDWISFSSYYQKEDSWGYSDFICGMQFGDAATLKQLSTIKVVYFDDQGNTVYLSEEIEIPSVSFYQDQNAVIIFNTETLEMNPSLEPFTEPYLILTIIVVSGLIAYSIIIELVLAFVFQLKSKKAILNILFINFITQGLMYIYFLIIFDAYESQYFFHLYIYEAFVLIVEFLYLYWRLKPTYTWKHIALFVIVSNIVSYLLGIIRYY